MTKLQKQIEALRAFLPRAGLKEDKWGHFQKDTITKPVNGVSRPLKLRVKMQATSVRIETKKPEAGAEWHIASRSFIKDITYPDADTVRIGRFQFKVQA